MNEHETIELLKRRMRLTEPEQRYNNDDVKAWLELLGGVDYGEAVVAMNRACTSHGRVSWHAFHEELGAHKRAKVDHHAEPLNCADCGGTGWKEAPDLIRGGVRYSQSIQCNHDRGNQPIVSPREGIPIMLVAAETEMRARGFDEAHIAKRIAAIATNWGWDS